VVSSLPAAPCLIRYFPYTSMEAARILKQVYPNPKRTIIVGLWGAEEQGLIGSRAYAQGHHEVVANLQAVFNQDNGTGRVSRISIQGLTGAHTLRNGSPQCRARSRST